ncbi:hypothetical protein LHK35_11620, partial [Staphylococcus argenteus]|nr:hypothetical protein [Staphylococcus argenteus]
EIGPQFLQTMQIGGAQHREIGFQFLQTMQVGGAQHREIGPQFLQAMQVGAGRPQTEKLTESQLTFHKLKLMFVGN